MKPTVSLIEGTHITAHDKRNIVGGIDYLRETFARFIKASPATVPSYAAQWLKRRGSKKAYSIDPVGREGRYRVQIRETYRNDYGVVRESIQTVLVEVGGSTPLYLPQDINLDNAA